MGAVKHCRVQRICRARRGFQSCLDQLPPSEQEELIRYVRSHNSLVARRFSACLTDLVRLPTVAYVRRVLVVVAQVFSICIILSLAAFPHRDMPPLLDTQPPPPATTDRTTEP
jgi:hypothetical protein